MKHLASIAAAGNHGSERLRKDKSTKGFLSVCRCDIWSAEKLPLCPPDRNPSVGGWSRLIRATRVTAQSGGCDQAAARAERQEYLRIMAIDVARSRRMIGIQRNETDASLARNLARRLLAHEALAATTSQQTESATVRIYEKLRQQLSVTVGVYGFQVLASRALRLSTSEYPKLSGVQITADGILDGLGEVEWQTEEDQNGQVREVLIAQLLGLCLIFLGEPTTLRLAESLGLQLEVRPESDATDPAAAGAPEDLLREAERLRSGSDRIQTLVHKHPGIGDRLVSVAGEIRKLAMVLDVFALIPRVSEGQQEGPSRRPLKGYVM
jgi:hypothetical protein